MDIKLQAFQKTDIKRLMNWVNSKDLLLSWSGNFFDYPLSEEQCSSYCDSSFLETPERLIFTAINTATNEAVGHIDLDGFDALNESAFICRVLVGSDQERNQNIGSAIVNACVNLAFKELHLHRIAAGVLDFNQAAIHCYKKCGFKEEGTLRELVKVEDKFYSMTTMSLLRSEWLEQQ